MRRLLPAAIVAGAFLVSPSAALAGCSGGPSAVNVYSQCVPSGGGGKHVGGKSAPGQSATAVPVSSRTAKALKNAGKDQKTLKALVTNPNLGAHRILQGVHSSQAAAPSALGSAFDLGSGPTALLVLLAGTAFLLLGGSGLRVWRNRHRS